MSNSSNAPSSAAAGGGGGDLLPQLDGVVFREPGVSLAHVEHTPRQILENLLHPIASSALVRNKLPPSAIASSSARSLSNAQVMSHLLAARQMTTLGSACALRSLTHVDTRRKLSSEVTSNTQMAALAPR
eukprot:CAMPEP_0173182798 /NCGR_PEP_ID=MMETSP1141-20130122/8042_1 /TAXON_ID=483371 /ORGANISM="non described non described, Strain CCMP2298" /LENGTH=129 /DNA_ID=CAMNT_0014105941 /DNA_START=296 /DNA_END=686 /DNA_ORIENTATION=-